MIYKRACFTGHRKINNTYTGPVWNKLEAFLENTIANAVKKGIMTFISGGAVGVDQTAAKAVIKVRNKHNEHRILPGDNDVHLVIARPFANQAANWPDRVQNFYTWLCEQADRVHDVSTGGYTAEKMTRRDKWMVDNSDYVIAVWDGRKSGGTYNTMMYAHKQDKSILIINPITLDAKWHYPKKEKTHEQEASNTQ